MKYLIEIKYLLCAGQDCKKKMVGLNQITFHNAVHVSTTKRIFFLLLLGALLAVYQINAEIKVEKWLHTKKGTPVLET